MKRTQAFILILTFLAFSSSVGSFLYFRYTEDIDLEACRREQNEVRSGGGMTLNHACDPSSHPAFLLSIALIISIAGIFAVVKNQIFSTILFIFATVHFPYWFWWTRKALLVAESIDSVQGIDLFLFRANAFDIVTLVLLLSILAFQIANIRARRRSSD